MHFQKESMTDEAIDIITSTFNKLENKHINLLRGRAHAFDKEYSRGWAVNRETGNFLIAGSGFPASNERYYYYYYDGEIFNLIIRSVYYGGVLGDIRSTNNQKVENPSQDFKDNLIEAFMALEKDSNRGGKLTFGVKQ